MKKKDIDLYVNLVKRIQQQKEQEFNEKYDVENIRYVPIKTFPKVEGIKEDSIFSDKEKVQKVKSQYIIEEIIQEFKDEPEAFFLPTPKYITVEKQPLQEENIDLEMYSKERIKEKKTFKNLILFVRDKLKEEVEIFKSFGAAEQISIITSIATTIIFSYLIARGFIFVGTHRKPVNELTDYERYVVEQTSSDAVINEESYIEFLNENNEEHSRKGK